MDGAAGNKKVLCPLSLSLPRLLMSLFAHRFATRAAPARRRAKKLHFPKWTGKERRLRGSGKSLFLFHFLKETKYPLAGYKRKIICQLLGNICSWKGKVPSRTWGVCRRTDFFSAVHLSELGFSHGMTISPSANREDIFFSDHPKAGFRVTPPRAR